MSKAVRILSLFLAATALPAVAVAGEADAGDDATSSDETLSLTPEERARAEREEAQPRPPLPDVPLGEPPAWKRHVEVGIDFVWVSRPFSDGLVESRATYQPAPGVGVHLHWNVLPWLRFHPYFHWAKQPVSLPPGSLTTDSPSSIGGDAHFDPVDVTTFSFGGKVAPTWEVTDRSRMWLSVGVGYGRIAFPETMITEADGSQFPMRARKGVFVEVPIGVGVSYDIIPRWLAIEYEASAAPVFGQSGDAHEPFQAVDAGGSIRHLGGFGAFQASFVQTIGLSLIL